MPETRINPDTGVVEEKQWNGWAPSTNSEGREERINPDTGVREEKNWSGWAPSENSDGRAERINPDSGASEEKRWSGWAPSENPGGREERINPDTGVREEKHWNGWAPAPNSEGREERINPDTGVREEKHWSGWAPSENSDGRAARADRDQDADDDSESAELPEAPSSHGGSTLDSGGYSSGSSGHSATSNRSSGLGWIVVLFAGFLLVAVSIDWFNSPVTDVSPVVDAPTKVQPPPAAPANEWSIKPHEPVAITIHALQGKTNIDIVDIFTRTIKLDRQRRQDEVFNLEGWSLNTKECIGHQMPTATGEEVEVTFFKIPKRFYVNLLGELAQIYAQLGLKPDPYTLAVLNGDDPSFSRTYPNMVQWKSPAVRSNEATYGSLPFPELPTGEEFRHLKFRASDSNGGSGGNSVYCGSFTLGWSYKSDGVDWWYAGVPD